MPTTTHIESRIASLATTEGDVTIISGDAIGADDLTRGLEGDRKVWLAEHLEAAAHTLEGTEINPLHSEQTVGKVVRAGWDPQTETVVYEAELEDEKLAQQVEAGQLDVSIEARHADGGTHEETGAMVASDIKFTGLSLVQMGAAPSNSAEAGPARTEALAARLSAAQIDATLSDDGGVDDVAEEETEADESTTEAEDGVEPEEAAELNAYMSTSGVRFRGKRDGKLDKDALPSEGYESHYLFDGDTKSESSYPVVDSSGYLRRGNVAAAYSAGARGQATTEELHEKLRPLNAQFDTPPIEPAKLTAEAAASDTASDADASPAGADSAGATSDDADAEAAADTTDDAVSPEDGPAEDPADTADAADGATDPADTPTDSISSMTDDPTETDEPSVADLKANLADVREENSSLKADLDDVRAERDELQEDLDALEAELAAKADHIEAAKREFAAALVDTGETLLNEDDLVERFDLAELAAKYEDAEEAALAEPIEEDPEPAVQSGGGQPESATLSDTERKEKQELESRLADLEDKDNPLAEAEAERIESELAALTEA